VRLLTLTGPPGVGKTRLALALAHALAGDPTQHYPDGVIVVPLASISDPALVAPSIARALGLREQSGSSVEMLAAALDERRILLLLDNFEQVIDAAVLLSDLLAAAPDLRLLVTSRTVLRLAVEQECPVAPLALPAIDGQRPQADDHRTVAGSPAVQLFVERARAARPGFVLTPTNTAAVAAVCVQLDGLPLAIELAAARIRLFSPEQLLARMQHEPAGSRLHLLGDGSRDMPSRQRMLRAAIDWSYQLLRPAEQGLFCRLGVFVGGWTLAAAEALDERRRLQESPSSEPTRAITAHSSTIELMSALVDQSLVQHMIDMRDEPRYVMLETMREYALEQLQARGELAMARQQHAAYFTALAEAAEPRLRGAEQSDCLADLEREHGNIHAALAWAEASRHPGDELASMCAMNAGETPGVLRLRLAGALRWFWFHQGAWSEGRRWLEAGLLWAVAPSPEEQLARARATTGRRTSTPRRARRCFVPYRIRRAWPTPEHSLRLRPTRSTMRQPQTRSVRKVWRSSAPSTTTGGRRGRSGFRRSARQTGRTRRRASQAKRAWRSSAGSVTSAFKPSSTNC
jgi:predicted ATPase